MSGRHRPDEGFSLVGVARGAHHARMDPRYPIGRFTFDPDITSDTRAARIAIVNELPLRLAAALDALPPGGLDRPYREGGWTARQVVHHVADSHLNAYMRLRLALTEDDPTIRTYEESRWAELPDARTADPAVSMGILRGIHERMRLLFAGLTPDDFTRTAQHPEWGRISVDWLLQMYAWHSRHHVAHLGLIQ
jgi:hypothetical protein